MSVQGPEQAVELAKVGRTCGEGATAVAALRGVGAAPRLRTALEIPWLHLLALVLAVPVSGAVLAWAFTPADLPLSRRGLEQREGSAPSFVAGSLPLTARPGAAPPSAL